MDKGTHDKFKAFTIKFFETNKITDSYKDVQWGSTESQNIRFQYLCKLFEEDQTKEITLLDVGCGLGHLYDFILEKNYDNIRYSGLDIQRDFIEFAKKKHPDGHFMNKSLFELETDQQYDYLVASGTFSVTVPNEDMKKFLEESVEKMFTLCNKGIAFNLLTTKMPSEYIGTTETHFDPVEILDMCFKLTNRINVYHSYKPNDFTILMYK
ncbi:class I SAM-dependent methyltransferase [Margalitia sp. FSL K6-0131]|uniref:class I SAM-dependent methyltransferase n=1 Tax=Margalitia sp. FSL K6-0131 TaxID=2954604 RepID=UPI0030F7EBEA